MSLVESQTLVARQGLAMMVRIHLVVTDGKADVNPSVCPHSLNAPVPVVSRQYLILSPYNMLCPVFLLAPAIDMEESAQSLVPVCLIVVDIPT